MAQEIVEWFHESKDFGFITDKNSTAAYVYHTSIQGSDVKAIQSLTFYRRKYNG